MQIIKLSAKDSQRYDQFVRNHPLGTIHQIWDWGIFQSRTAVRDHFLVLAMQNDTGAIEASALIIRQKLPLNLCWLYCPRGPLADYSNPQNLQMLFAKIAELARHENAIFFRFDPPLQPLEPLQIEKSVHGQLPSATLNPLPQPTLNVARPTHAGYQPESTLILDLTPEPDQILAQMKPKGRYNIKVAQKHGVTVRISGSATSASNPDLQSFYALLRQTTARDHFSSHPIQYYQSMLATLGPNRAKLYLAQYQNQTIATAIVTYFKDTATYYFGASSDQHRNVMAPYLLHWQIMLSARAAGYKYYDLFGIAPGIAGIAPENGESATNLKGHPWAGVTAFKLKFGGTRINYLPAQEIVYRPFWYQLIKLAKRIRGRA